MNAFIRLGVFGAAVIIGGQLARWEPGLAFPLGAIAVVWVAMWLSTARYDEQQAMDEAAEYGAVESAFGPDMVAIAVEDHRERWAES